MSEPQPIGLQPANSRADPRAAIARAARATGVDFDYLLAQAKLESSLDPSARAPTSSAAGLYQFTRGTWLATLDRHGEAHGLGWAGAAIEGGRVTDPALRSRIMALRFDADASALMAAELAQDNRADLSARLGREPDAAELYLAHFLGTGGAGRFLSALSADPGQSAAALLPQAAAANRTIFFERSGAPRSVGGVMELLRGKVNAAMEGESFPPDTGGGIGEWPASSWASLGSPPRSSARAEGPVIPTGQRPSMAETLKSAFGLAGNADSASAPAHVRSAYASLRKFGL